VSGLGPPCFAAGTLIDTETGPRPIEEISIGDRVRTLDHGFQPVLWVGSRQVSGVGKLAPIRFAPNSIGNDRALVLSPQHRVLVGGWRAELLFGCEDLLVAAAHLVDGVSIVRLSSREVCYHHLMFAAHEMILSEGAATESLFPGEQVLSDPELRAEIAALFPEVLSGRFRGTLARRTATAREAALLHPESRHAA
jgi:hypothetical protein